MEISKRIVRAKVQLQNDKPFFAYLIMNMRFIEDKNVKTLGVNSKGDCFYNPKFIEGLSEKVLEGVLAHEVMHVVLEHFSRSEMLDKKLFNISADLCVNDILRSNDFELYHDGLNPRYHSFTFENDDGSFVKIEDIDKKTAENIYNELLKHVKNSKKEVAYLDKKQFDEHIKSKNELTKTEKSELKNKWKRVLSEAITHAKEKGKLSEGLGLFVDKLLNEKVNWKYLLYKYLTQTIPHDYTYSRPSKRSFSTGVYMPTMRKEFIEIVVSLDTSGSIQNNELTEFMSEINGIAKSFNNLSMKLIVCDSEIKDVYTIGNGDSEEIAKLRIKGGGGTDHKPVYDYVKENLPNTKLLVNFTDGYTYFDELDETINTLWVISKGGINENKIPFGEVIKLN